ncbi:MAG TPA: hypothetical protein VFD78_04230 [Chitinophagaceae bacterium]|nr:hypothetical protein [Chitinophagaceae bacterium]
MLKRYFTLTPIVFPIIGLALIIYFLSTLISVINFGSSLWEYNLQPLPLFIYTALWLGICFAKRTALIGFIVFTVIMLTTYYLFPEGLIKNFILSALIEPMPVSIALSVLILIFYQKIDRLSRGINLKEVKQ